MNGAIKKTSLVDEAYTSIRQKICDFELYPGQDVSDFILSKELKMSRTPIRQALLLLEYDGLIGDAGAGKSYKVNEITEEEIEDIFEAREAIEVHGLQIAMRKGIDVKKLERLKRINSEMEYQNEKNNIKLQFSYDQKFHNQLVAFSGNQRLIRFYDSLLVQLERMRVLSYLERSYQEKAYNDHHLVLERIECGDVEGASQALTQHIRTSKRDYCDLIHNKISLDSYGMLRFFMKKAEQEEDDC